MRQTRRVQIVAVVKTMTRRRMARMVWGGSWAGEVDGSAKML